MLGGFERTQNGPICVRSNLASEAGKSYSDYWGIAAPLQPSSRPSLCPPEHQSSLGCLWQYSLDRSRRLLLFRGKQTDWSEILEGRSCSALAWHDLALPLEVYFVLTLHDLALPLEVYFALTLHDLALPLEVSPPWIRGT